MTHRSDEPVYWGIFGAGGMVISFALPAILILMILQGLGVNCFANVIMIGKHWWGAGALFVIVAGSLWHGLHRIYHGLHDLHIHTTKLHQYVLYGAAFFLSSLAFTLYAASYFNLWLPTFQLHW